MSQEAEKKGLLGRLFGRKKAKKGSCCCDFELEEIPDENENSKDKETHKDKTGNSCCK